MNKDELCRHVENQVMNFLCCRIDMAEYLGDSLERTKRCLEKINSKYNFSAEDREICISVYNSVQYCIFLYNLSRVMYEKDKNGRNAEKIYYLNKILNSVDLFYAIELPCVWGTEHPLGSVMGRAKYDDYFFFYQGCTVGGNGECYPIIGKRVIMYSNSKVLGNSKIGNNVLISANTYIKDQDVPDNSIVFGQSTNLIIKRKTESEIKKRTAHIWKE